MQRIANPSTPVRFRPQPHTTTMIKIKVGNLEEAIHETCSILESYCTDKNDINLCLTGGNLGEGVSRKLDFLIDINKKFNFLLSDERFVNFTHKDSNQRILKANLKKNLSFSDSSFFPFKTDKDYSACFERLRSDLIVANISKPDFLLLSLGEDGHLAGHFHNSILDQSKIFCFTDHAPKLPRKRVSFSMKWLFKSDKIILAAIGKEKKQQLQKFLAGEGLHSNLITHPNLTVLF